jgi:hypothetical protein
VRISLKAINSDPGIGAARRLCIAGGDGYLYFLGGEATDWLDRTVRVPTVHSLALEQWIEQYRMLREKEPGKAEGPHRCWRPGARTY